MTHNFSSPFIHLTLTQALNQISSWITANLLALTSTKIEFFLIGLEQQLAKYKTAHSTSPTQLAILVLLLMNILIFQTEFLLCLSLIDLIRAAVLVSMAQNLKANLPSGPDSLRPIFFKELKYSLARPLALLYQQSLSVGSVGGDWSRAITPVFKREQ